MLTPRGIGWITGVGLLGNLSTASGSSDPADSWPELQLGLWDFFISFAESRIRTLLNPIFPFFLLAFFPVSLPYFVLAVNIHECLGKHLCTSSSFTLAILN